MQTKSHRQGSLEWTKALSLIICVLLCGCSKAAHVTWSEELQSPDREWVAIAHSEQGGELGGDNDVTIVQLRRTSSSQPPIQILLFSQQYATIYLKMQWENGKQLNVTYGPSQRPGDSVHLDFQVVRCAGIKINVRDISSDSQGSM